MPTVLRPDATVEGADWTKKSWDLPPYKSPEFFEFLGDESLDDFRESSAYKMAVERGLIHDDEWVLDWCTPVVGGQDAPEPPPAPRKRPRVHLHLPPTAQVQTPKRAAANLTFTKREVYDAKIGHHVQVTWSDGHVDRIVYREGFESNGMGGWHDASVNKALASMSFLAPEEDEAIEVLHERRRNPGVR